MKKVTIGKQVILEHTVILHTVVDQYIQCTVPPSR